MSLRVIIKLLTLLLTVIVLAILGYAMYIRGEFFLLLFDALILTLLVIYICSGEYQYIRRLKFLISAIDNRDYTFAFFSTKKKDINAHLNTIKKMLENARNEVVEREKYYELIIDKISGGVVVTNANNSVLQTNSSLRKILNIDNISHLNNLSYYYEGLTEAFMSTQPNSPQTFSFTNEKEEVKISIQLSLLNRGRLQYKIYAVNNIANELDYKELESWNRISRVLTHEIMNSLTPIITISSAIKENSQIENQSVREGLEVIYATSNALVDFIDNYNKLSHVPQPVMLPIYVKDIVMGAVKLFKTAENSNIDFRINISPNELMFYVDQKQIGQIVINLLKNSVESIGTTCEGCISIDAYSDESENVIIKVSDSGARIEEEVAEQIFVPFFTTKRSGSGIGLSLSRQIMRLHNGTISLHQNSSSKSFILMFK